MKKNNTIISVAVLGAVTVLAFGVVYGAKYMSSKGNKEVPTISLEANESIGVKSVHQLKDADGKTTGYEVVVASRGFVDDIEMKVCFDKDATTINKLEILSQGETEGFGAKVTESDFLSQFEGMKAPVYIEGVKSAVNEGVKVAARTVENQTVMATYVDGVYIAKGEREANGWQSVVTITIENGIIASVNWDSENEAGEFKSVLSENGGYVMTENGPTWAVQAASMSQFVVDNQGTAGITMDENTKTDSVAGVSISVGDFVSLSNDCIAQAMGIATEVVEETTPNVNEEQASDAEIPAIGTKMDAISGATISSTAVMTGINTAYDHLNSIIK